MCDGLLLAWIARSLVVLQWAVGVCDGPLLVRLVGKNVSELTAAELLCALWTRHGATLHDLTTPGDAQLNHNHHRAATRAPAGTITSIVIIVIIGRPREHLLEPS